MNASIRWRIMVLQVMAALVFVFASGAAFYASNFAAQQVHDQLAPQQIYFPASAKTGLPADLSQYAGQQVLNGDQAHAYAEKFIGLHLAAIGKGLPYSYWSGQAIADTNPAQKAADQGIADTLFKGDTLRSLLNVAWTFWVISEVANYAGFGLAAAALLAIIALGYEVFSGVRQGQQVPVGTKIRAMAA